MKAMPKVSVIVPVCNVETYLNECVEAIRRQMLVDIGIILVDDGSPDRRGSMAGEYAKLDERAKVAHRSSGGLGPARSSGMEVATGEYVGFVDSDDWVESDMYEALHEAASAYHARIAFTGFNPPAVFLAFCSGLAAVAFLCPEVTCSDRSFFRKRELGLKR